jgi:hypothetical protein
MSDTVILQMHRINRGHGMGILGAIAFITLWGCQSNRLQAEPQTIPLAQSRFLQQVADIPLPSPRSADFTAY